MITAPHTLSKTLLLLTILLWPLASGQHLTLHAQQSQTASLLPTFEVASVKPNKSVPDNATGIQLGCHGTDRDSGINPGVAIPIGQCTVKYMPFKLILEFAYDIPMFQSMYMVSGGPFWLDSDRFDIQAKAEKPATDAQLRLMLRALLSDRFKLVLHREPKELEVLTLVVGKNGSKLKPSKEDARCIAPSDLEPCGLLSGGPPRGLHGQGVTLSQLVRPLTIFSHAIVEDGTGLTGLFDISTTGWDTSNGDSPDTPTFPTLPRMLEEQLGLTLIRQKKTVEIIVIDHVEPPSVSYY